MKINDLDHCLTFHDLRIITCLLKDAFMISQEMHTGDIADMKYTDYLLDQDISVVRTVRWRYKTAVHYEDELCIHTIY